MKRLLRTSFALFLLVIALLASAAWVASYFWWPTISFPWPTSGLSQTHDGGFLVLLNGRVFIVRQRVQLTQLTGEVASFDHQFMGAFTNMSDAAAILLENTAVTSPAGAEPGTFYVAADSRELGHQVVKYGAIGRNVGGAVYMSQAAVLTRLEETSWAALGLEMKTLTTQRFHGSYTDAVASCTAVAIPLWPLLLFALPAGWMARRGWRARVLANRGSCPGCGYDLRASKERCPECGRAVAPAVGSAT